MKKLFLAFVLAILVSACSSNKTPDINIDSSALSSFDRVYFPLNQYKICKEGKLILDSQIEVLKANPKAKILVKGYTDKNGSAEYNLSLGEKRAQSVKDYLVSNGIEEERIEIVSLGDTEPISNENGEVLNKENRVAITTLQLN